MAQILPYSAILCHFRTFCKENLYLNRQPLCFHHFARAVATDIPACRCKVRSRARQQAVAAGLSRNRLLTAC